LAAITSDDGAVYHAPEPTAIEREHVALDATHDEERTMIERERDIAAVIELTREKGTGAVRAQRRIHVGLPAPCNEACPAGDDIQAWLALAQAAVYRRVCYRGAVSIHADVSR
jgi:hypothetical protein